MSAEFANMLAETLDMKALLNVCQLKLLLLKGPNEAAH